MLPCQVILVNCIKLISAHFKSDITHSSYSLLLPWHESLATQEKDLVYISGSWAETVMQTSTPEGLFLVPGDDPGSKATCRAASPKAEQSIPSSDLAQGLGDPNHESPPFASSLPAPALESTEHQGHAQSSLIASACTVSLHFIVKQVTWSPQP